MYIHFEYMSGANSYIAFTEKETNRILRKYKRLKCKVTLIKPGFYMIDDRTQDYRTIPMF